MTAKDARREALAQSLDAKQTADLLATLVVAGWLKQENSVKTGGRPVLRWAVNPRYLPMQKVQKVQKAPRRRGRAVGRTDLWQFLHFAPAFGGHA